LIFGIEEDFWVSFVIMHKE
jgi:hypothetical protein